MESSRGYAYYREHATDVKSEDITSSERNKNIMQKLRDGDSDFTSLNILEDDNERDDDFVVRKEDDLGWLGYFIGESNTLEYLRISCEHG